jgi:hypothetical protein
MPNYILHPYSGQISENNISTKPSWIFNRGKGVLVKQASNWVEPKNPSEMLENKWAVSLIQPVF